jgi:hypothetical protein
MSACQLSLVKRYPATPDRSFAVVDIITPMAANSGVALQTKIGDLFLFDPAKENAESHAFLCPAPKLLFREFRACWFCFSV